MMAHVSLRLTHNELAKRQCQWLRVDMNYHTRPPKDQRSVGLVGTFRFGVELEQ